jgi:hypothetical protein
MGKPGPRELFESEPMSVSEWVKGTKNSLDAFEKNMLNLNIDNRTDFRWFYTYGFWCEALEFIDEYPDIWHISRRLPATFTGETA